MQTTKKINFNFIYYIIAVVCATAFFVHEFVDKNSQNFKTSLADFKSAKKERTKALNKLKQSQKGTALYLEYMNKKSITDIAYDNFQVSEKNEHFLGFDNFKQFLGEFGWAFGILVYSLFNIVITFYRKTSSYRSEIILHGTLMCISLYFITWALQQYWSDYNKIIYVLYSLLMTTLIVYSTYRLVRIKRVYFMTSEVLINNIKKLTRYIWKDVRVKYVQEDETINFTKETSEVLKTLD